MINSWAQDRNCPFPTDQVPHLTAAWEFSRQRLQQLRTALQQNPVSPHVACVAVSGSLSRMESHTGSDIDLLVVVDDRDGDPGPAVREQIYADTWSIVAAALENRPPRPKPGGIFSQTASWKQLTDAGVRGRVDEPITPYGQRMQLLLDAQPVSGHETFAQLQGELLQWSSDPAIVAVFADAGPFHWLTQEIHRYWHSIRARACWLHADEPHKAIHVNVKLRSSRLLLIRTFLTAIQQCHQREGTAADRRHALAMGCRQVPLERLSDQLCGEDLLTMLTDYESAWLFTQHNPPGTTTVPANVRAALRRLQHGMATLDQRPE